MAFASGDFTASDLFTSWVGKFQDIFKDVSVNKIWKTPLPAYSRFASNAKNVVYDMDAPFSNIRKCQTWSVNWLETPGSLATTAIVPGEYCNPIGNEASSKTQSYTKGTGFQTSFKVVEETCDNRFSFEEKMAQQYGHHLYIMDLKLEQDFNAFVIANADDISGASLPYGEPLAGDDTIWRVDANADIDKIGYFDMFAADNFMNSPIKYAGNKWRFEELTLAQREAGGAVDYRNILLNSNIVRSTHVLDTQVGSEDMFIIDESGLAPYNMTYSKNPLPEDVKMENERMYEWRIPSPRHTWYNPATNSVEPVYYDANMKKTCTGDHEHTIVIRLTFNGGWMKAPLDSNAYPLITQIRFANAV